MDAAERLLQRSEDADFSMRALAAEAGVSFVTPFNHFGGKTQIIQALSARVIGRMADRFQAHKGKEDAVAGVLTMSRIAVGLLLERPGVYKAVVGSLGVVSPAPSAVWSQSRDLWAIALADLSGLAPERIVGKAEIAAQLAVGFRGCLSFWIAGEIPDEALAQAAAAASAAVLLGFAEQRRRAPLLKVLAAGPRPEIGG
ncbi:TetR/AcrR family transcriptional regulator [Hansschlegelia quercus]|uniref:TetR/AcrR family transcriptional regulator n=1 Tax=Hansschlegelia quercus TaxID=2528245 RepID=UPI00197AD127|nr:TetR/AcrR family transcriptional regulator [Hansschlegelia quercus]